jgi:hypothetical protein
MFENNMLRALLASALLWATGSASGTELALEPFSNGGVSPNGAFSSAQLIRRANGYQTWSDYAQYYRFAVSATYLESPFDTGNDAREQTTSAD